jgi:hypothetical protein
MPNEPAEVKVTITRNPDRTLRVSPDPFFVHKHQDQYVKWECTSKEYFTVEFGNGSPFYESQFSTDSPSSGIVRRNVLADTGKIYKYTVRVDETVLDPGGGVNK